MHTRIDTGGESTSEKEGLGFDDSRRDHPSLIRKVEDV